MIFLEALKIYPPDSGGDWVQELTAQTIIDGCTFDRLLSIEGGTERLETLARCEVRARDFHCLTRLKQLWARHVKQARENGEIDFEADSEEKPFFTHDSLQRYLDEKHLSARYDEIAHRIVFSGWETDGGENLDSNIVALIYSELQGRFKNCNPSIVGDYLSVCAARCPFNPVSEVLAENYLDWDKVDRLPAVYEILGLPPDDTLSRTLVKKWLLQCASLACFNRSDEPFGADGVLVLVGRQGIGKTSFFRRVAWDSELFCEGVALDFREKDSLIKSTSFWICELGEVEATMKSDIPRLKAFITQAIDEIRRPYARAATRAIRRTSFCASCNSNEFLLDTTGNRRFWTVPVEKINLDALKQLDVKQLWFQIYSAVLLGGVQSFRLTADEQQQLAERNAAHEKRLKSEDEVLDILSENDTQYYKINWEYQTVTAFKDCHDVLKSYSAAQIGKALDRIGVKSEMKKISGKVQRVRLLPRRVYYSCARDG